MATSATAQDYVFQTIVTNINMGPSQGTVNLPADGRNISFPDSDYKLFGSALGASLAFFNVLNTVPTDYTGAHPTITDDGSVRAEIISGENFGSNQLSLDEKPNGLFFSGSINYANPQNSALWVKITATARKPSYSATPRYVAGVKTLGYPSDGITCGANCSFASVNRTVIEWGANDSSQLGNGSTSNTPVPTSLPTNVTGSLSRISSGENFTMAVGNYGYVWAWGSNDKGQLGTGNFTNSTRPVQVPGLVNILRVVAGPRHCFAISTSGQVWAWGDNTYGQLGLGDKVSRSTPTLIPNLTLQRDWEDYLRAIAAGRTHTIAIGADGRTVYAWGDNSKGQLGIGNNLPQLSPVVVSASLSPWQIAAGDSFSMLLAGSGKVYTWGDNTYGQLGGGTVGGTRLLPGLISGPTTGYRIAAGTSHCLLVTDNGGKCWSWGRNQKGQLGDGTTVDRSSPVGVNVPVYSWMQNFNSCYSMVAAGDAHSLLLQNSGQIRSFGNDLSFQLGNRTDTAP